MTQLHPTKLILGLLAVPIAAGSAWLVGAVGKYGLVLDKSGVNALATAAAVGALGLVAKLIHDVGKKYPALEQAAAQVVTGAEKADPSLANELEAWPTTAPTARSGG